MIQGYADHAANERTFLAWVRTGVAVIAFGFVIERFNLFLLSLQDAATLDPIRHSQLERLSGPSTHYQGLALIVVGIVLLIVATIRFVRTERMLADPKRPSHLRDENGSPPVGGPGGDCGWSRRTARARGVTCRRSSATRPATGHRRERRRGHADDGGITGGSPRSPRRRR
jgi:putative membrane protein